jgi:hypothetical protein
VPEIFVSLIIVVLVCYFLYWLGGKVAAPFGQALQIIAAAGGFLWLLLNVRTIIHAITSL